MNELKLSDDLNIITAEINSYKQVAGQSIIEIGARLKHVKENDLANGEWASWCESIGMDRTNANKFIRIFNELGKSESTSTRLGFEALYQIATLPEPEREKSHEIPSTGETKTVDEMTVRELREVKKALKETELRLEQAENKPAERVEVVKEVIPESVRKQIEEKDRFLRAMKREAEKQEEELHLLKSRASYADNQEKREQELKGLQFEADKTVLVTKLKMDDFLKEVAITAFRKGAIAASSEGTRKKLKQGVEELKAFCAEMELALSGRIDISKRGGTENE